jgi:hypothetical protein
MTDPLAGWPSDKDNSRFKRLARQVGPLNALADILGEYDVEAVCVCGCLLSEHVGVRRNGGEWKSPCKTCPQCEDFLDGPGCLCRDCLDLRRLLEGGG